MAMQFTSGVEQQYALFHALIARAELREKEIRLEIRTDGLWNKERSPGPSGQSGSMPDSSGLVYLTIPAQLKRCGHSMRLLVSGTHQRHQPARDVKMIQGLMKAHDWLGQITSGKVMSVTDIARKEGVTSSYITRILYRAFLAPDIVRAIPQGNQPAHLTSDFIKRHSPLPVYWKEQRAVLRFEPT